MSSAQVENAAAPIVENEVEGGMNPAVDNGLDTDSAYADENASYTTSIRSSVLEYRHEYGRRYHSFREERRHFLPNDEKEQERMDIHHTLMLALLRGELHRAPIKDPQRVLDVGTGNGAWALDFGDAYPTSHVIGNDLSPIQPSYVPPNVEFVVDDIEDAWAYESSPFDYVHARYLTGSIRDWPRLVSQAYECTKPGGWAEFQDWDCMLESHDDSIPEDNPLWKWHLECSGRMEGVYTVRPGPKLEACVKAAGFENVVVEKLPIPLGTWPKDKHLKTVGFLNRTQLDQGLEAVTIGCLSRTFAAESPAWSMDEIVVFLADVRKELSNHALHGQYTFYVVYGQKPMDNNADQE